MMAQFMMDLKPEPRLSPSLYSPASPKIADSNCRPQSTDSGVLDLSKRRDSLDTRKTPSPSSYHCYSDAGGTPPPSNHSSPQCEAVGQNAESTILLNYGELMRARRLSPAKSLLHFEELAHQQNPHNRQTAMVPGAPFHHHHGMAMVQPNTDILQQHLLQQVHRAPAIPSYLLPAAALQHHHLQQQQQQQQVQLPQQQQQTGPVVFSPSPIRLRDLDALSESGSEGASLVTSSQRKPADAPGANGTPNQYPMVVGRDGKLSRPFKAYPRDPLSLAAGFVASDTILDTNSAEKYNLFRKRMLEQIHAANGGQPTVSNPKMRRLANSSKSGTSSLSVSAAMSDASSESCDEKPPTKQPVPSNMAAKAKKQQHLTAVCDEMALRAAANQRRVTPSKEETRQCDSDSSQHSDSDSKQNATDSSCELVTGSNDRKPGKNGGAIVGTSSSSHAASSGGGGGSQKDSAYYERRKKNNAAAKKSRDRRRIKEDEIAIRAAFLERENIELKFELAAARKQLALYGATASVAS